MDGYEYIAAAVIEQAAWDYYNIVSNLPKCPPDLVKRRINKLKKNYRLFQVGLV